DITELRKEAKDLAATISQLEEILNNESELLKVIKDELRQIKKKYASKRLTKIEDEIEEIKIETEVLVAAEDVMTVVTREGYIKRSSLRSFAASKPEEVGMKDGDEIVFCRQLNTLDHLLILTNLGNMIYRPIFELTDMKWKDTGEHLSQSLLNFSADETVLAVFGYNEIAQDKNFVLLTQKGMIKQTKMSE